MSVADALGRPLQDLRLSVTDRCNFRCPYCMPGEVYGRNWVFLPRKDLLTFEEMTRLTRIFVALGVEKVHLTGGEPLLRPGLERLIQRLVSIEGLKDLALTTNGALLASKAVALRTAGLRRVTVSLDSLNEDIFRAMSGSHFSVAQVLEAIEVAAGEGLAPIKINMVVKRGINERDIVPMAGYFRHSGCIVRFIEYMDVGSTNGWRRQDVVSAREIMEQLNAQWQLEPVASPYPGEVARYYRYADGGGEVGVIASVTQPFCRGCTRARLSAEGRLYTCLFGNRSHDLRQLLRAGNSDPAITASLKKLWRGRSDRYSTLRREGVIHSAKVEMSRIGG